MAHRTKATTTDFKKNTITARITDNSKSKLDKIHSRHNCDENHKRSMSDSLEIMINYYYDNIYMNGIYH